MRATLAASREPAGKLWQLCKVFYVYKQKNAISFSLHSNVILYIKQDSIPTPLVAENVMRYMYHTMNI